jgi:hypothetical protein
MKLRSLALTIVALSAATLDSGLKPAFAAGLCVELTAAEFNHRADRRGDDNACAGEPAATIKTLARERARDNAMDAIASHCLNSVTSRMAQRACARAGLASDISPNNSWGDVPPAPRSGTNEVRYLGHATGSNGGANLCAMARDMRLRTHNVVDGHCPQDSGLLPHRTFATARAQARCGIVCRTP